MHPRRVLIAIPDLFGEILSWRLGQILGPDVTHTFRIDTLEDLNKVSHQDFDLLLVDSDFRDGCSLGWLRRGICPKRTVVVTKVVRDYPLHQLMMVDVAAIIHTSDTEEFLAQALRTVLAGGTALMSPRIRALRSEVFSSANFFAKILSRQEQNILAYIGRGLTTDEIACRLKISAETVVDHRKNMMRKLGLKKQTALLAYANNKGFASSLE